MSRAKRMLSRRKFLGGAGVAISLPFLRSLAPSSVLGDGHVGPKRLMAWYVPNGIHMAGWTPSATGTGFELSTILQPLADVRDDILVVSGLANRPAEPDGPGDHASGTGAFITAAHPYKTEGSDIRNGISMDQVAANELGDATRFRSIQLGIDGGSSAGGCDSGYSCAYARNISWADSTTPLPKTVNPRSAFDRLFGGFDPEETAAERERRRVYKTSVLDYAREDARQLKNQLAKSDQLKLEEFTTAVREVEVRIAEATSGPLCELPDRPPEGLSVQEHIDIMSDLQVLALQCDLTRIITFMMSNAGSYRSYPFLGISGGHHEISHHQGNPQNFEQLTTINRWEVERFAYLLERMKNVEEADGSTLLDNTTIFFSSEIEDGNSHAHVNMPILLAGKGGGAFRTGRHVRFDEERPVANLFISMLNAVGVEVDRFGDDGTGPLDGLG